MALTVIRLLGSPGAAAARAATGLHTACLHNSAVRRRSYGWLSYIMGERTSPRLQRLSKIITVEGNLASGKEALGQKLAEKLGMLFMPQADCGYLDLMLGEATPLHQDFNGMCSLQRFYTEPQAADGNSFRLQLWLFNMRLLQYADAVQHLLTTGQGVVLERSPFSDVVFLDAMFKQGYIRKECVDYYHEIRGISICEFLPPHLVIYLDVPAEEVQRRLKQKSESYLKNIPLPYLKSIEESYKKSFLPQISETSEMLVYDGTQPLDGERVAEDVEYVKFEKGPWLEQDDVSYHHMRMLVEDKPRVASLTSIPKYLPEITISAQECDEKFHAFKLLPGKMYAPGYNSEVGDKHVWRK
ncbi:NADH dehydrogenase [ubiquinone] 1 alpha subcomplex subunit 10, mitochondrial [Genypterus blacodes]|uniref:NADH dehydrogenase [ubiquinone] 1 alpha subcomplex subunit 10, mitochondrial n=1 Tax=Genypterus blacodes TaxID=154954 RepID=UPI003F77245A